MIMKINNTFSSWSEILLGVTQDSILGLLLCNIYLIDLFFINIESDLCNFADDNTLHLCDLSRDALVHKLEASSKSVIKWFDYNYMKLNESKCKLLISGNKGHNRNSWELIKSLYWVGILIGKFMASN